MVKMGFSASFINPYVFQYKVSNTIFQMQVRVNVVSLASPRLQELYKWLEVEFHPLQLCSRVHSAVEELRADESSPLQQYVPALQDVTLVRLIRQVSQVYQTIEIARLLELARFASAFHLERLLVDCVRHNDMQVIEMLLFILTAIPLPCHTDCQIQTR
jgi:translation initiation factor 3 subunit A